MSYDAWKLRSPDDKYPEEECFHEEHETDWEGRATCSYCGTTWWLTADEIRRERRLSEAYDRMVRREERRERYRAFVDAIAFWRRFRKPRPAEIDDEIPF